MPTGFHLLIAAQFASALADNALLIVIIARLLELNLPAWWAPMLKFGFTISYVVLAPFVGPLADALPKARLMAWMNGIKLLGVFGLALGLHPFAAFAIVGFGAAAYAPAKYGLVTELVGPQRLVMANGWLEVSVVCAALFGTVLGGLLVSPWLLGLSGLNTAQQWLQGLAWLTPSRLAPSIGLLILVYGLAAALNLGVPASGARYPSSRSLHPRCLCRDFWKANRKLWADADGGLSLAVTTLFWGVGATLQFAVLRWAADVLHLPLSQSAYLQAAVALGVIAGAAIAGRWVPLHAAKRMLAFGVLLGLLIPAVASAGSLLLAIPLLVLIGAVGGLMVVPLNALLQHRGYSLLSAGRSIAVQGFNENASVLAMLAAYAGLLALDVSIVTVMWGFGLSIALAIAGLMWREARSMPEAAGPITH
ncbi:lysophospholipid transporter LplT [Roseateles oligotrophus]|uniref:Lysophospholipid transporter LplT n=1 Tax=Roseateles oligotrophus TaxID=1769250 RepID=A0ABT2YEB7_9BURK|nr:lysophospholipid transporter LplT [Roseateles oligotrophus]MCV2368381.1 lysophospholipid transporter LplT [Roseateles oligotrophus]